MGNDLIRLETLKAMIESAKNTIVLAESEKFQRNATVSYLNLKDVACIITDSGIQKDELEYIKSQGVTITTV